VGRQSPVMALDPIHDVDPTGWLTLGPHVG